MQKCYDYCKSWKLGSGDTHMKKDKKERTLSEAEQRRLERFQETAAEVEQQGYTRHDLTIDIGKANVFAILLLLPLFVIGYGLLFLVNHNISFGRFNAFLFLAVFIVLIAVHELIHGICWSFSTPHHFKDIEFGIMKSSLTPYCACLVPLKKGHYVFGTVMPLIILGILPMVYGIAFGRPGVLFLGILMADAAAGDILIIRKLLQHKISAKEIVYMDHPTEAGGVVFER